MIELLRAFITLGWDNAPGEVAALLIGLGAVIAVVHIFGPS